MGTTERCECGRREMARKLTGRAIGIVILAVALLGGVFAVGVSQVGNPGVALAGSRNPWTAGDCERTYAYDFETGTARQELSCWANDWALSVPAPSSR
jgi:hypothetical protein